MASVSKEGFVARSTAAIYIERSMEFLWLLAAVMVPLIFVGKNDMLSEAVNAYVEVPKTTGLRTLVGMMTMLWIVEWAVKGGLSRNYSLAHYSTRLKNWVVEQPSRWVVIAATIYVVVVIVSTLLSQSFWISVWGEVPGQFSYSAYTTVSYFLLFAIIVTHLKTRAQLRRLLVVIVAMGTLAAAYGIIQHYDLDPLDQGEAGSFRVASTMANSVFAGALYVGTSLLISGVGIAALNRWGWSPLRVTLLVSLIAVQLMAVFWTGASGSWLLGVPVGVLALLFLTVLASSRTSAARAGTVPGGLLVFWGLLIVLGGLYLLLVLGQFDLLNLPGLPFWRILLGLLGVLGVFSLVVVLYPNRFAPEDGTFAKSYLVVGAGLLVTLLVVALTVASFGTPALDLRDFSGLVDLRALLGVLGFVGALSFLILVYGGRLGPAARALAKSSLIVASGLLIALLAIGLTLRSYEVPPAETVTTAGVAEEEEEVTFITPQATARGVSYRTDIWDASLGLVARRPWFEYESLTLSPIRWVIGYGPELFKYTFPLESPLGGLLSHAHNFFLHHAVEQGILGLLSSLGLFIAFFSVGAAQLWRNWGTYSTVHKWILLALLATMVGRLAEMLVGVARESDLVLFWILLAIMVVLPSVMRQPQKTETAAVLQQDPRPTRQERRLGRPGRRERCLAHRSTTGQPSGVGPLPAILVALLLALPVAGLIGYLTWDKNVDYAWAAVTAASARERFAQGDEAGFQESLRLMSRAAAKAPDVPIYHNNVAGIYDSYRRVAQRNPQSGLPSCADFFSLEPRDDDDERPYVRCAEEAYLSNLQGYQKNRTSPQAKLTLANSTMTLAQLGYDGKGDEAIRYFEELTDMIPSSFPLHNGLATAYINLGRGQDAIESIKRSLVEFRSNQDAVELLTRRLVEAYEILSITLLSENKPEEALRVLDQSLTIIQGSARSARAFYLQGLAYRMLNDLQKSVESLERSIAVDGNHPDAAQVHRNLSIVYDALGDKERADEHSRLYEEIKAQ